MNGPLSVGRYQIIMMPSDNGRGLVLLLDSHTGRTWKSDGFQPWTPIPFQKDAPAAPQS